MNVEYFFYDVHLSVESLMLMSLAQSLIDVVGITDDST